MAGWMGQSTDARILRLEDLEVSRGTELAEFKREIREDIVTIKKEMRDGFLAVNDRQDGSQKILISILVAIIVGIIVGVVVSQLGGAA